MSDFGVCARNGNGYLLLYRGPYASLEEARDECLRLGRPSGLWSNYELVIGEKVGKKWRTLQAAEELETLTPEERAIVAEEERRHREGV